MTVLPEPQQADEQTSDGSWYTPDWHAQPRLSAGSWVPAKTAASPAINREKGSSGRIVQFHPLFDDVFATAREDPIIVDDHELWQRLEAPLQRLRSLSELAANWDSYNGDPPSPAALTNSIRLLVAVLRDSRVPVPQVVPLSSGGIQLEWHRSGVDLEIEVTPEKTYAVFVGLPNGQTREGDLSDSLALDRYLNFVR